MKLSILIPVYNAELYIGRCLDSLLDQNIPYKDYEILLRDDGSTDKSIEVIESYVRKTSNIKLVKDTNKGAYVQRNLLIEQAEGDYIYLMDADDYLLRNSLKVVLDMALKYDLDLSCFDMKLASWDDAVDPQLQQDDLINFKEEIISGATFLEENPVMRYEIWWYIIRKEFLKDTGIVFNENRYHQDVLFTINLLLKAEKIVFVPIVIYYYFQSTGSIMRTQSREHANRLIDASKRLIFDLNELIKKSRDDYQRKSLTQSLMATRDKFSFYLLVKLIKAGYKLKDIDKLSSYLQTVDSYPIKYYNGADMSSKKFKKLNLLIHNRFLLQIYLSVMKTGLIK
ncbi:glycosyltransferase [Flavimarina sp. Hel_I_48]|uniref:glycosyltransferase n=1 Tax=Flavimarina sp. Hel_I_48 TaxID=1392488 RepID=UPI0004DEE9DF|nr:glycosyltransferase [Flavimarina sp. Hel_I_48]